MAINKAEILGLDMQNKETKKEDKVTLDEIIESSMQAFKVEQMLSSEAAKMAIGAYDDEVLYNIPRRSSIGKEDWGILCEKIPGGCINRRNKEKHVHTIGVGINGAIKIMNAYGGLEIEPSDPEMKELTFLENGKLVTKAYWGTKVMGINKKTDTKLTLPFMHPVMKKTGDYYQFDEYGMQICVSKGLRNLILKLIPENIQQKWIKEYMEAPVEKPKNKPQDNPKEKNNNPSGNKPENGDAELTVESAIEYINAIEVLTHLTNWYNKNANWVNKLKSEDKKKVVDVFNAKKDAFSTSNDFLEKLMIDLTAIKSIPELEKYTKNKVKYESSPMADSISSMYSSRKHQLTLEAIQKFTNGGFGLTQIDDWMQQAGDVALVIGLAIEGNKEALDDISSQIIVFIKKQANVAEKNSDMTQEELDLADMEDARAN